jgi:DNA ligase (NAD+)
MSKEKIEQLRKELEQHNYNYYVLSAPTISDMEFDAKLKELQSLEEAHPEFYDPASPTQRVGSDISDGFTGGTCVSNAFARQYLFRRRSD